MKNKDTCTAEEYKQILTKNVKKNKYRNVIVRDETGKIRAHSTGEDNRHEHLKLLEKIGEIHNLEFQKPFILQEAFVDNQGKKRQAMKYIADFVYIENGITIIEDYKGFETKDFKIKEKLLQYKFKDNKNIKIVITFGANHKKI